MLKKNCLVISAMSGTGKSTVIKRLIELNPEKFQLVVSCTSRPQRLGEIGGKSYKFKNYEEMMELNSQNKFIEMEKVHGNLYGTEFIEIDRIFNSNRIPILDIDVKGFAQIRHKISTISVFLLPPSIEELHQRLMNRRTENASTVQKRMNNGAYELVKAEEYDYLIQNLEVESCAKDVVNSIENNFDDNKERTKLYPSLLSEISSIIGESAS